MSVPESIECSFRDQIMTKPYDKITVSGICEAANVSRTLFYTHFDDKDNLLERIIYKDIIQPTIILQESLPGLKVKSAPQLILEQFYLSVFEKREFYSRVNAINNHANLTKAITDWGTAMSGLILENAKLSDLEKTYLAYFTASANAMLISKWIERGYDADPKQMAQFFRKWVMDYWGNHYDLEYSLQS